MPHSQATIAAACLAISSPAFAAITLTGNGTPGTLSGSLGTVDVMAISDGPLLGGALTNSGAVNGLNIPVVRIQYDLHNRPLNDFIDTFTVFYEPGVSVVAASIPGVYIDDFGNKSFLWGGSNGAMLFDAGFGNYDNELALGGRWTIDYQTDFIRWNYAGPTQGFIPDTATGRTDEGSALPTFSVLYAEGTLLGENRALVNGTDLESPFGRTTAAGNVVSAIVPEPASLGIIATSCMALGLRRRR